MNTRPSAPKYRRFAGDIKQGRRRAGIEALEKKKRDADIAAFEAALRVAKSPARTKAGALALGEVLIEMDWVGNMYLGVGIKTLARAHAFELLRKERGNS